jgi:hypothetical protein
VTELREQIARAIANSPLSENPEYALADAVMAVVGPFVEQLRQAEVPRDAYRDERDQTQRERDEARASVEHLRGDYRRIRKDRDRLLLAWRSARRRANQLRWLHAEAVWQREQLRIEANHQWAVRRQMGHLMIDADSELTEAVDLARWLKWRGSRTSTGRRGHVREVDASMAALSESAFVLPEPVQRLVDWHLSVAGTNVARMPLQSEVREAMESWRATAVEAAPTERVDTEWCVFYGGTDPSTSLGIDPYDDEADATEKVPLYWQWQPTGVAKRTVRRGPWEITQAAGVSGTGTEASGG